MRVNCFVQERESSEATETLLNIPGFAKRRGKAERQIAEGKATPVQKLRWKFR